MDSACKIGLDSIFQQVLIVVERGDGGDNKKTRDVRRHIIMAVESTVESTVASMVDSRAEGTAVESMAESRLESRLESRATEESMAESMMEKQGGRHASFGDAWQIVI